MKRKQSMTHAMGERLEGSLESPPEGVNVSITNDIDAAHAIARGWTVLARRREDGRRIYWELESPDPERARAFGRHMKDQGYTFITHTDGL